MTTWRGLAPIAIALASTSIACRRDAPAKVEDPAPSVAPATAKKKSPKPATGAAASCTDTTSDPRNCGVCGHDCRGAACSEGLCAPIVVAESAGGAYGIALDATHVYWTTVTHPVADDGPAAGEVRRVPIAGGTPETIADRQWAPTALALDDDAIYWVTSTRNDATRGTLMRLAKKGGKAVALAHGAWLFDLVLANGEVYWVDHENGLVAKMPTKGGDVTTLAADAKHPEHIAVDAQRAYWSDDNGIHSVPIDGGASTLLSPKRPNSPLALDAGNIYANLGNRGEIGRIPVGGGPSTILVHEDEVLDALVVLASHLYWLEFTDTTWLLRAATLTGHDVVTLATVPNSWTIAVDTDYVYTTVEGRRLIKVPR